MAGEPAPIDVGPFECLIGIVQNSGSTLVGTAEICNVDTDRAVSFQLTGRLSVRGDSPARIELSGATGSGTNRTSFRMWGVTTDEEEMDFQIQIRMGADSVFVSGQGTAPSSSLYLQNLTPASTVRSVVKGTGLFEVPYSLVPFATSFASSLNKYTGLWSFSATCQVGSLSFVATPDNTITATLQDLKEPDYDITRCKANAGYGTMNIAPDHVKYKVND